MLLLLPTDRKNPSLEATKRVAVSAAIPTSPKPLAALFQSPTRHSSSNTLESINMDMHSIGISTLNATNGVGKVSN